MAQENEKTTAKKKQFIKNVAALKDDQIRARIRKAGLGQDVNLDEMSRQELINYCHNNRLWRYEGDVVPKDFKAKYGPLQRCGDEIGEVLYNFTRNAQGTLDLDKLREVQKSNGIDPMRWAHCNPGQQMMNTGNVLRGKLRNGELIVIGADRWNAVED